MSFEHRIGQKTVSLKFAAGEVHRTHIKTTSKNGKHIDQWLNTLRIYAFPKIGNIGVEEISSGDIYSVLSPIWIEKQETARRVLQRLKAIFDWTIVNGYRKDANPVIGIKMALPRQKKKIQHFNAIEWLDAPDLMRELVRTDGIGAKALRFTIFTASRSGPIRKATWDQFSTDLREWTIPARNMKADRDFVIPLPSDATDLLKELRKEAEVAPSSFVFPSPRNKGNPLSENTMSKVLKSQYPDATVHGMRSVFRDWSETYTPVKREVKEFALAHGNEDKVESAYLRTQYMNEREELMEVWGRWLMGDFRDYHEILNQARIDATTTI